MSTTPVRSALPCSKVGMASGPPRRLTCTRPLPSLFTCSTKRTKISPKVVFFGTNTTALSVVSCAAAGSAAQSSTSRLSSFLIFTPFEVEACQRFVGGHDVAELLDEGLERREVLVVGKRGAAVRQQHRLE